MIIKRDEAFKVICSIRTRKGDNEIIGTGMFVSNSINDVWIVTASHVALETNNSTYLIIGDKDSKSQLIPLILFNTDLNWVYNDVADIAVLRIIKTPQNIIHIKERCFPIDHLNLDSHNISRDVELTAMGFPNGLGVNGKFNPLTFRSYASSSIITFNRFDTGTKSEFFCLENPSVGGYSGGPVFDLGYIIVGSIYTSNDKTICYGFIHGTLNDTTGGKLAVVTPAYYLKGMLK